MDRNVVINQVYATINNRTGILLHDTLFISSDDKLDIFFSANLIIIVIKKLSNP